MEKLKEIVSQLLHSHFSGSDVELEPMGSSKKIGGHLVWRGFSGKDQIDRQRLLWKWLRSQLSEEDQAKVTAIFTLTPRELAVMREDPERPPRKTHKVASRKAS